MELPLCFIRFKCYQALLQEGHNQHFSTGIPFLNDAYFPGKEVTEQEFYLLGYDAV
jgi:hypothetical protein